VTFRESPDEWKHPELLVLTSSGAIAVGRAGSHARPGCRTPCLRNKMKPIKCRIDFGDLCHQAERDGHEQSTRAGTPVPPLQPEALAELKPP